MSKITACKGKLKNMTNPNFAEIQNKLKSRLQKTNALLTYLQSFPEEEPSVKEKLLKLSEDNVKADGIDEKFGLHLADDAIAFYIAAVNLAPFSVDTIGTVAVEFLRQNGVNESLSEMLMGYYMVWFLGGATRQVPLDRETIVMLLKISGISEEKHAMILGGFSVLIGYVVMEMLKELMPH